MGAFALSPGSFPLAIQILLGDNVRGAPSYFILQAHNKSDGGRNHWWMTSMDSKSLEFDVAIQPADSPDCTKLDKEGRLT